MAVFADLVASDDVTEEQQPVARLRRSVGDWIRLGLLVVALVFSVLFVANRWSQLSSVISRLPLPNVVGSVLLGGLGSFLSMMGWRAVLADLGADLPVAAANRVFFLGQLGKYLPGSVWSFLAQADLATKHKVTRKAVLAGSVLGAALSVAVGLALAIVFLPFGSREALHRYWWVILAVPGFLVALHPRIAGGAINGALRLVRRQPLDDRPSYLGTLRAAGWYALGWLALALHAWLLVIGLRRVDATGLAGHDRSVLAGLFDRHPVHPGSSRRGGKGNRVDCRVESRFGTHRSACRRAGVASDPRDSRLRAGRHRCRLGCTGGSANRTGALECSCADRGRRPDPPVQGRDRTAHDRAGAASGRAR